MEAAYTTPGASLPAYINARVEGDEIVVRVRSEGAQNASEIRLSAEDWRGWLGQASHIGGGPRVHRYWGANEADCPQEIKAGNGELHTLRCKVCGEDNPRTAACAG